MQKKRKLLVSAVFFVILVLLCFISLDAVSLRKENHKLRARLEQEIQQGIADEVFRLHVIANSDDAEDQKLKIKVKTAVTDYLEELLGENATLEETKETVLTHLNEIEEKAEEVAEGNGFDYPIHASVERTYFPDKTYGDCTFPAGEYEALNVRIGSAKGQNWWCVLYPALCFIDDTYGIVPENKKGELKTVLTEIEFDRIVENPNEKRKVRIGFRWF